MTKITSLTDDQKKLLNDIIVHNFNKFNNWGKVDEDEIVQAVHKLYSLCKLKAPKVVFLKDEKELRSTIDSTIGSTIGPTIVSTIDSTIGPTIVSTIDSTIVSTIVSTIDSTIGPTIVSTIGSTIVSTIDSTIVSTIDSTIGSTIVSTIDSTIWCREDWWTQTYAHFFSKIIPGFPVEMFEEYRKIYDAGFAYLFLFEKTCFVIKMPEKVYYTGGMDNTYRLHSDKHAAFDLGFKKLYFLNGVQFEEELWKKVTSGKMPFQDILNITDVDQRGQAMKYGDWKQFTEWAGAKMIDQYTKLDINGEPVPYELWEFPYQENRDKRLFSKTVHYARYMCPSTKEWRSKGVPDYKTVAKAMAWGMSDNDGHVVTPKDWRLLVPLVHES